MFPKVLSRRRNLNYTPASYESLRLSGAVRPCCGIAATLTEQPARGSLVQAQTHSRLVICAVALCERRDAVAANLSSPPQKIKATTELWLLLFGGEGEI